MNDRDTLWELYEIVCAEVSRRKLPLAAAGLPVYQKHFGLNSDVYYRRRLNVCRTLIDLHLPVSEEQLDIMLAAAMVNYLPVDNVPADHEASLTEIFAKEPRVAEVLSVLYHNDYMNKVYYTHLVENRYALIIRLTERSVLTETLYEWSSGDAMRFIRDTKEFFFPMCLYAKEHYPEFGNAATILQEKMRYLIAASEALLRRYEEVEDSLHDEILSLREENAAFRTRLKELRQSFR